MAAGLHTGQGPPEKECGQPGGAESGPQLIASKEIGPHSVQPTQASSDLNELGG